MLQRGREANLSAKTLGIEACDGVGREHLDHDAPGERNVFSAEDVTHPATAELSLDVVLTFDLVLQRFADAHGRRGLDGMGPKIRSGHPASYRTPAVPSRRSAW